MVCLPSSLSTRRLTLRRYTPADAGWYAGMAARNKAHLARHERGNTVMRIFSEADATDAIQGFAELAEAGRGAFLGAFDSMTGAFACQIYVGVGDAALPGYLVGYFCDVDHLRQGFVTEAARAVVADLFTACGAERVGLWCDDTNEPSQAIAARLSMLREAHIRKDKRHDDGTVTGSFGYGLLRDEFLANGSAT